MPLLPSRETFSAADQAAVSKHSAGDSPHRQRPGVCTVKGVAGAAGVYTGDRDGIPSLQPLRPFPGGEDAAPAAPGSRRTPPDSGRSRARALPFSAGCPDAFSAYFSGAITWSTRPSRLAVHGRPAPVSITVVIPLLLTLVEGRGRQTLVGRVQECDVDAFEETGQLRDHGCICHRLWQPDDRPGRVSPRDDHRRVLRGPVVGDPRAIDAFGIQVRRQKLGVRARSHGPPEAWSRRPVSSRRSHRARPLPPRRCDTQGRGSPSPPWDSPRGRRGGPSSPSRSSRSPAYGSLPAHHPPNASFAMAMGIELSRSKLHLCLQAVVACSRTPAATVLRGRAPTAGCCQTLLVVKISSLAAQPSPRATDQWMPSSCRRCLGGHHIVDDRPPIAALRDEPRVAKTPHQHDPGACDAGRTQPVSVGLPEHP